MSRVLCSDGSDDNRVDEQPVGVQAMKDEYDFSGAERGKFYRPNLRLIPPLRLEPQVLDFLATRAQARGTTLNALLNELLKKDIELIALGH